MRSSAMLQRTNPRGGQHGDRRRQAQCEKVREALPEKNLWIQKFEQVNTDDGPRVVLSGTVEEVVGLAFDILDEFTRKLRENLEGLHVESEPLPAAGKQRLQFRITIEEH